MERPTVTTALEHAAELCKEFEGLRLSPYLCPAKVPTIGYGSTIYMDGRRVALNDPAITEDQAEALLEHHLVTHCIQPLCLESPGLGHERPERVGALASWAYNLGMGNYRTSTLRRAVDAGNWPEVCVQLKRWTKAGKIELPGLVKRRAAEAALIQRTLQ